MSHDIPFSTLELSKYRQIKRVIVVGAGIAGLGVARALTDRGYEVIVVEGRERIGGRCYTKEGVDYGAHWIHGTEGNPITNLARQLGVNTLFVGGDSSYTGGWGQLALYAEGGRRYDSDEKLKSILLADDILDEIDALRRKDMNAGAADISLREAARRVIASRSLNPAEQQALDWHLALVARDDCAAGDEQLSFQSWDEGYDVYGYGDSIVLGGYEQLVNALAQGLDIRLNQRVEAIHYQGLLVSVTTNQGVIYGDAVVVTLPLGVLKANTVQFVPPLPAAKQEAIARLGMGCLAKVIVRFEEAFWPHDQYVFGYRCRPVSGYPTVVINLWKSNHLPALALLAGGEDGRRVESLSAAETQQWAMTVVRDLFGSDVPQPLVVERTDWSNDPFARGAYAYIAVGSSPADMDALAEPVDKRIFFAGEATYRAHWATTHGAYASALREAARITGDLSFLPTRHSNENRRWRDMMMRLSRFINVMSKTIDQDELQSRLALLRKSDVFSVVANDELRMLATMFEQVDFADGDVVCRAGDPATHMFLMRDGEFEVQLADGTVVNHLRRGSVVGEYGMFGAHVRTATLTARGASTTLTLDYQRFQRFLLAFPEAAVALLGDTVQRMTALMQTMADLTLD
jgi:monoamine oxidase